MVRIESCETIQVRETISQIFRDTFNQDSPIKNCNLYEMGLNSLSIASYKVSIEQEFSVALSFTDIVNNALPDALAQIIARAPQTTVEPGAGSREDNAHAGAFSATLSQRQMFAAAMSHPSATAYNVPVLLELPSRFSSREVRRALRSLADHHPGLRASFRSAAEGLVQVVSPEVRLPFTVETGPVDFSPEALTDFRHAFDLEQGTLWRAVLFARGGDNHSLLLEFHHIIIDGTSVAQLVSHLWDLLNDRPISEPPAYRTGMQSLARAETAEAAAAYWDNLAEQTWPVPDLPMTPAARKAKEVAGKIAIFPISRDLAQQIQTAASTASVSKHSFVLGCLHALMAKLSRQSEITIGVPRHGRMTPESQSVVGCFVHTLPTRLTLAGDQSLTTLISDANAQQIVQADHQAFAVTQPNFSVVYTSQDYDRAGYDHQDPESGITWQPCYYPEAHFQLTFHLNTKTWSGAMELVVEYDAERFDAATIADYAAGLLHICEQACQNPDTRLDSVAVLSPEKAANFAGLFNRVTEAHTQQTVADRFAEVAKANPDAIALRDADQAFSYHELDARSEAIAAKLIARGVASGQCVAVLSDRSAEYVTLILGILKCGAAYVPLDPDYPAERLSLITARTQAALVVSLIDGTSVDGAETLHWNELEASDAVADCALPERTADTLAYIMFTSGSTGEPKGVGITDGNILRIASQKNAVPLDEDTTVLLTGSPSFDATTYEIWGALLNGGTLAVVDKATLLDANALRVAIDTFDATHMWLTAPLFERLAHWAPDLFGRLEYLIVGGDVVSPAAVKTVYAATAGVTVVNGYGPTENTTFTTLYPIPRSIDGSIPLGRPLAQSTGYIMDAGQNVLPPFALGELYAGGGGVAQGYVNAPEITAEKFIEHSWPDGQSERLYRTGDCAFWDRSGLIHLQGRMDEQVKIRGFRVEPNEIRDALLRCQEVQSAFVIYDKTSENDALVAYLVPEGQPFARDAVMSRLQSVLPDHMLPTHICELETLPLNVNGKVDRTKLPSTIEPWLRGMVSTSQNETHSPQQSSVLRIWQAVLGRTEIGLDDNFFSCGGDSLKLQELSCALAEEFDQQVGIARLYQNPTVRTQADLCAVSGDPTGTERSEPITAVSENRAFPANEAQTRLFLLDQTTEGTAPYMIPTLLGLTGTLDAKALQDAWTTVCHRHDFLRSRFFLEQGKVMIALSDEPKHVLEYRCLADQDLDDWLANGLSPLDLQQGEVVRASLLRVSETQHYLALLFHHCAFDGVSIERILSDLAQAYRGEAFSAPAPAAMEQWQNAFSDDGSDDTQAFWQERLENANTLVDIPTDFIASAQPDYKGGVTSMALDDDVRVAIQRVAQTAAVTPYTVYLAVLLIVLRVYARQSELSLGIVSNGRGKTGTMDAVGMFARTLPACFELAETFAADPQRLTAERAAEFLRYVQSEVGDALEHEDVSLLALLADLPDADGSRHPFFNIMFTAFSHGPLPSLGQNLTWSRARWTYPTSKFDLNFMVYEDGAASRIELEFASSLFLEPTASRMLGHYISLLKRVGDTGEIDLTALSNDEETLGVINALNDTEKGYETEQLIHRLFEDKAKAQPDNIAVDDGAQRLTYGDLENRANQVARVLHSNGVRSGTPVVLMMDRSVDLVVAVLGVLKSGGYYVPIEPSIPTGRLAAIVETLDAATLITDAASLSQQSVEPKEAVLFNKVLCLGTPSSRSGIVTVKTWLTEADVDAQPKTPLHLDDDHNSQSIAYVIFTSGSTGVPKGVEVSHRPVINLLEWVNGTYDVGPDDTLLFVTSPSFDLSVYDIFGTLAAGGKVRVASRSEIADPLRLVEILRDEDITFWDSAPAAFQQILQVAGGDAISDSLKTVFLSGDWVPVSIPGTVKRLLPNALVVALGGATEATVWSNYFEVREDCENWISIPYGKPIQNARYYVLNETLNPLPVGVPGKLFIGGECLANGYVGQPDVTERRFIPDPFCTKPGAIMYDTGDIARWRSDGNLQFLGREDHQVKINGYRIELGEIAYRIKQHDAVSEAIVLPQTDALGEQTLVAHVIADRDIVVEELCIFLAGHLPTYMIPKWYSFLSAFPVTANGKFDRAALASVAELASGDVGRREATDTCEAEVQALWQDVLGREHVPCDVAFHSLGGSSVKLVRLHALFDEKWPGFLRVPDLMALPTVQKQADKIRSLQKSAPAQPSTTYQTIDELVAASSGAVDIDAAIRLLEK